MQILTLILIAFFSFAAPAFAEEEPADEAIVRELIEVTEAARLLDDVGTQIDAMMEQSVRNALAGKPVSAGQQALLDELRTKVVGIFRESMSWQAMEPMIIEVYRKSFTRKEIEGMLDFYRTDAGRAVIAKLPLVMQHTMAAMQDNLKIMMPKIQAVQTDILARLKALDQPPAPGI
jgi:hypothetical protein